MTKIGNGNSLICGLLSKSHTVRAQNTLRSSDILPIHSRKLTQMTKIGNGNGLICGLLKFRKWFKNGLKAQKLLAQGIALGIIAISKAPCKGKSLIYYLDF